MTAALTEFITNVAPHVSGCPNSLIVDELRNAAIRLCEDSLIHREDIAPADITIGVDDYTITPPAQTRVVTVLTLYHDEKPLNGYTEEELDHLDYGWRNGSIGPATGYTLLAPDRIKLNRVPEATITGGLVIKVALKPTETATVVDDVLYNDWQTALTNGALAELLMIPKKPWTDYALAKENATNFNFQIQRARARQSHGFQRKPISAKMRHWV